MEKETSLKHPVVGDTAPDVKLHDDTGQLVRLSALWQEHPLVLLFVRHFGCPLCREHAVGVQRTITDSGMPEARLSW